MQPVAWRTGQGAPSLCQCKLKLQTLERGKILNNLNMANRENAFQAKSCVGSNTLWPGQELRRQLSTKVETSPVSSLQHQFKEQSWILFFCWKIGTIINFHVKSFSVQRRVKSLVLTKQWLHLDQRRWKGSLVGSVSKGESVKESSRCKSFLIHTSGWETSKDLHFRSGRPNVQGKAVTREATREAKLKRGGMKERLEGGSF